MDKVKVKELEEKMAEKYAGDWGSPKYWRSWGSWFSWGSPIGLTLGYAIVMLSTGVFIWLLSISK